MKQERPHRLRRCAGLASLIWHQAHDLLGDLAIFPDWAGGFQHRQDRIERIAMDACDTLDFLDAVPAVLLEGIARAVSSPLWRLQCLG